MVKREEVANRDEVRQNWWWGLGGRLGEGEEDQKRRGGDRRLTDREKF